MTRIAVLLVVVAACGGQKAPAKTTEAATSCPGNVTAAVTKEYPDGKQESCEAEREDGKDIFEVVVIMPDNQKIEVELSPAGVITQTEQVIPAMPEAVATAFAAKYPGQAATRVERHTIPGKPAMFEVMFGDKEATFDETGAFVDEEAADKD